MTSIPFAPLRDQALPDTGRPLLAVYDEATVVVWQTHTHAVADEILRAGPSGADERVWRLDRTTRLRLSLPSLLARNDWGTRPGRDRLLAVRLSRAGFDTLLRVVVPGENLPEVYSSDAAFRLATRFATATVQWHPDRDAAGEPLSRQTPRYAIRDHALQWFTRQWVVGVEDLTPWVLEHRARRGPDTPLPVLRPYPEP